MCATTWLYVGSGVWIQVLTLVWQVFKALWTISPAHKRCLCSTFDFGPIVSKSWFRLFLHVLTTRVPACTGASHSCRMKEQVNDMLSCSSIGTSLSSLQFSSAGHFNGDTLFGFFWQLSIEHMWNYSFKQLLSIYCVYYPAKIKHLLTEELCNCQLIIYVKFTFDWLHFANKSKWIRFSFIFLKDSLCIGVLPSYICVCVCYNVHAQCPVKSEENFWVTRN